MKKMSELYTTVGWGDGAPGNYTDVLDTFGFKNILQVDQRGYQGDTWILFEDGQKIGYLQYGWGSCSGCDAFQGCDSLAEMDELQKRLY